MVAVPVTPLLHVDAQSTTTTLPALPIAPMWMCAAVAGPLSFAKVSFHVSFEPLSVPLNWPCAAVTFTTCFGTSWPAVRAAVQVVVRVDASESAVSESAQTAPTASARTNLFMVPSWSGCERDSLLRRERFLKAALRDQAARRNERSLRG